MPSLFIVLEKKIPNFDIYVNGNRLSKESDNLERVAKQTGVKSLMSFFSICPEELVGLAEDHGVDVKGKGLKAPEEKWFSAEEGLHTVRSLVDALASSNDDIQAQLVSELREFERVLVHAHANNVRWHLGVDY